MKKITIVILALISQQTFAQKESFFRMGAKAGVNVNKIDGQAYKDGFNYNFQAGVFGQFNITKKLSIQPEINFVQTTSEFTNDANTIYNDLFGGGTQHKAKLDYLEVPILLNVNVGPTKKIKFQIGPAYNGLLQQTVDSLKAGVKDIYKKGEISAITGFWIQFPLVNISARYKLGLSDINNTTNPKTWKNHSIQISVGATF